MKTMFLSRFTIAFKNPKSGLHLISPYIGTALNQDPENEGNDCQLTKLWLLNEFSLSWAKEM